MWIGKISFCLLLWRSITLMSSALNRTQAVRLCLFCDQRNRGNTPQAKHIFRLFPLSLTFPDHGQIPWLFQVFQVGGRPEINHNILMSVIQLWWWRQHQQQQWRQQNRKQIMNVHHLNGKSYHKYVENGQEMIQRFYILDCRRWHRGSHRMQLLLAPSCITTSMHMYKVSVCHGRALHSQPRRNTNEQKESPVKVSYQYGVPMNVFRLPMVLSNWALTPKSTAHTHSHTYTHTTYSFCHVHGALCRVLRVW